MTGMADSLDCLTRRRMMNSKDVPPDRLKRTAQEFVDAGFLNDAVDWYAKSNAVEELQQLTPIALAEGDYFLFCRLLSVLGRPADDSEWAALAENAAKRGKDAFAAKARGRMQPSVAADEAAGTQV